MIVIGCSAVIELLTAKSDAGEAVGDRVAAAHTLYAPHVTDTEIVSALLGRVRGKKITEEEADTALANYRAFPIEWLDVLAQWNRVKTLRPTSARTTPGTSPSPNRSVSR